MQLFVSNIDFDAEEIDLRKLMVNAGYVPVRLTMCMDKATGKFKGYAFIDVDDQVGQDAIAELDGAMLMGRNINVQMAREKAKK